MSVGYLDLKLNTTARCDVTTSSDSPPAALGEMSKFASDL